MARNLLNRAVRHPAALLALAIVALLVGARIWYVRTELTRVRDRTVAALARHDGASLLALTDPYERKGLNVTGAAVRLMLQETLWNHGVAKADRVHPFIMDLDRGRADWLVTWLDKSGRPIPFRVALPQAEASPDRLFSIISVTKGERGWRVNFTNLVRSGCFTQRGGDGRFWYRSLCRRTGVTGFMGEDRRLSRIPPELFEESGDPPPPTNQR